MHTGIACKNNVIARRMAVAAGLIEEIEIMDSDGKIVGREVFGLHPTEYRTPMLRIYRRWKKRGKKGLPPVNRDALARERLRVKEERRRQQIEDDKKLVNRVRAGVKNAMNRLSTGIRGIFNRKGDR